MTAPLKPMTLGEILDRTLHIYRSRFPVFAGLAALPAIVMLALQLANAMWWRILPTQFSRQAVLGFTSQYLLYIVAVYLVSLLIHLLLWPAIVIAASRCSFGERPAIGSVLAASLARWAGCIWLAIAHWGIVLLLPEAAGFALLVGFYLLADKLGYTFFDQFGPQLFAATLALGWVAFLGLSAGLSFAFPVWSLERTSVRAALRRSWMLSRGGRMRIVWARLAPAFTAWLFNIVLSRLALLVLFFLLRGVPLWFSRSPMILMEMNLLIAALISTVFGPLFPIAITLLYYDQRVRREGYDIELLMAAAGMETATVSSPNAEAGAEAVTERGGK